MWTAAKIRQEKTWNKDPMMDWPKPLALNRVSLQKDHKMINVKGKKNKKFCYADLYYCVVFICLYLKKCLHARQRVWALLYSHETVWGVSLCHKAKMFEITANRRHFNYVFWINRRNRWSWSIKEPGVLEIFESWQAARRVCNAFCQSNKNSAELI